MYKFKPIGDAIGFNSLQIKESLKSIFLRHPVAERAYLSMARYNNLNRAVPVLCVRLRTDVSKRGFDEAMHEVKASLTRMLGADVAFDLIVLDEHTEAQLRTVSTPFFDAKLSNNPDDQSSKTKR